MAPFYLVPNPRNIHLRDAGAGHFAKMVHNGIEYGMMQAYAEGFEILEKSHYDYHLRAICCLWNQGSVQRFVDSCNELIEEVAQKSDHLARLAFRV